jgi:predicted small secreted protein
MVKRMRARKHVQYQFRVEGKHVQMGTSLGWRWLEESSDYIGVVYQFGVKRMRARKPVQYHFWADGSKHVYIPGTTLGWTKKDHIGFVYEFGVKSIRDRKHVQYQFR